MRKENTTKQLQLFTKHLRVCVRAGVRVWQCFFLLSASNTTPAPPPTEQRKLTHTWPPSKQSNLAPHYPCLKIKNNSPLMEKYNKLCAWTR